MYQIILRNTPKEDRRELYALVEDFDGVAELDREKMGQSRQVEVPDIPVRR